MGEEWQGLQIPRPVSVLKARWFYSDFNSQGSTSLVPRLPQFFDVTHRKAKGVLG